MHLKAVIANMDAQLESHDRDQQTVRRGAASITIGDHMANNF